MLDYLLLKGPVRLLERAATARETKQAGRIISMRLNDTLQQTWEELLYSRSSLDRAIARRIANRLAQLIDAYPDGNDMRSEALALAARLDVPTIRLDEQVVASVVGHINEYKEWSFGGTPINSIADLLAHLLSETNASVHATLPAIWLTDPTSQKSPLRAGFFEDGGIVVTAGETAAITSTPTKIDISEVLIRARWPRALNGDVQWVEPRVPVPAAPYLRPIRASMTIDARLRVVEFTTNIS